MPRKPLDQLSSAYRRRIERAEAKGKTRQQARGKKVGEHKIRKQKEIENRTLTSYQRQAIRKFAKQQAPRFGEEDDEQVAQEIFEWANGDYDKFVTLRKEQQRLHKYKVNYGSMKMTKFIALEAQHNAPIEWFYYH